MKTGIIMGSWREWICPINDMTFWEFLLRSVWVVLQISAAYCLADQVSPFFYQRF